MSYVCTELVFGKIMLKRWRAASSTTPELWFRNAFQTSGFRQKRATKSYWPSLLITAPTIAQLITWQSCLAERISVLIWEAGALEKKKKKESGQHIKTELSNNVKVRKSYLAGEIPISYTRMTTGSNHGRTLQWAGQASFQSDRHIQLKMITLKLHFYNYKSTLDASVAAECLKPHCCRWVTEKP